MTGLVYLAIIALWVVFLVPWFSRHRDDQIGRRKADRYRRAMSTLSRSGGTRHRATVPAEDDASWQGDLTRATDVWQTARSMLSTAGKSPAAAAASRRRARVLVGLSALLVVSLVLTLLVGLPGVVPVALIGLLAVYGTLLARSTRSVTAGLVDARAAEAEVSRAATLAAQQRASGLLGGSGHSRVRDARPAGAWDAVPQTLPTYVSKPKASKFPRVLDLTAPGHSYDAAAMLQQAAAERSRSQQTAAEAQFQREMAAIQTDPMDAVAEYANPEDGGFEGYGYDERPYRRAANE